MEQIKQWTMGLCIGAVIGSLVLVLSPKGSVSKSVRTGVALFIMCVIFSPFVSGVSTDELFDFNFMSAPQSTEATVNIQKLTENELKKKITESLLNCGIKNSEINIDISINENNEMSVENVKISADRIYENNFSQAESVLKLNYGIVTKIEVTE